MAALTPSPPPAVDSSRARAGTSRRAVVKVSPKAARDAEAHLGQELSLGYKPALPFYTLHDEQDNPFGFLFHVETMRKHHAVRLPLQFVLAPVLSAVEWEIEASSADVARFAQSQLRWFWNNAVGRLADEAYCYGWAAGEMTYDTEDGLLVQCGCKPFHPRDVQPLELDGRPVGVQVTGQMMHGTVRLHGLNFSEDLPAKAFWYGHQARYGELYGRAQIRPAWRPWRRLSGVNGAEEISDLALYRYGTGFVITRYPTVEQRVPNGTNVGVNGRASGRDVMREIGESLKAGAAINLPNAKNDNGDWQYDITFETPGTNLDQIGTAVEALERQCMKAIGVPPELMEASDVGSGYSGRAIPLQGFLTAQQPAANDMTRSWVDQIGKPLVRWNFGPDAWVRVRVKPLLETYKARNDPDKQGGDGGGVLPPGPDGPPAAGAQGPAVPGPAPGAPPAGQPQTGDDLLKALGVGGGATLATVLPDLSVDELIAFYAQLSN